MATIPMDLIRPIQLLRSCAVLDDTGFDTQCKEQHRAGTDSSVHSHRLALHVSGIMNALAKRPRLRVSSERMDTLIVARAS
jgi:hypothetical protein